ncbi:MAG: DMT family transporter [Leptospiraceae bacterium]|nr:DMT family transporter [Leptospiraceae bacterium]
MNLIYVVIFAMILWGISWASAKMITNYTNFEVILFWRLLVTFLSLVPVLWITKDSFRITKKAIPYVVGGGLVMLFYNALFFLGLRNGLPGAGGVFVTTLNPIFNFFLVALLYKYSIQKIEYFGLALGLSGGLIILKIWNISIQELLDGGNVYFLVAAFTWAVLTIITAKSKSYISPVTYSLYLYGIATLVSFCIALPFEWLQPLQFDSVFWINLFYLATISTSFGTTIYFIASSKLGSAKASSFIFLVPASAVLSSWIIVGEKPELTTILGGLLAISAVYLLNRKK